MTRFVLRRGYSHATTYDIRTLPETLNALSGQQINTVARKLVTLGDVHAKQFLNDILPTLNAQRSREDREATIQVILTVTARIGVTYVLPEFLHSNHGFQFLKKSPLGSDVHDSDVMLEFGKTLAGTHGQVIKTEMDDIRRANGFR